MKRSAVVQGARRISKEAQLHDFDRRSLRIEQQFQIRDRARFYVVEKGVPQISAYTCDRYMYFHLYVQQLRYSNDPF